MPDVRQRPNAHPSAFVEHVVAALRFSFAPHLAASAFSLVVALGVASCTRPFTVEPVARFENAEAALASAKNSRERFYALPAAAKAAFNVGRTGDATAYAVEGLALSKRFPGDWNYGNAVHDGHLVLGRAALKRGNRSAARQHLLEAGDTPGSPQLNSFGPNMTLARDLLLAGERDCVLTYFTKCRRFWSMGRKQLAEWELEVQQQRIPTFRGNLLL